MNPDVFAPVEVPAEFSPFFRRVMVAHCNEQVSFDVTVRGTGYCYLGWTPSGRWCGAVNSEVEFDSDVDGRLHLSGQVYNGHVEGHFSGILRQIFCEFTALGQYEFLGIEGSATFEKAINPCAEAACMSKVRALLEEGGAPESSKELANVFFAALREAEPERRAPEYLHQLVARLEDAGDVKTFSELLRDMGVSERKARDDFSRIVGLTPKRFSKLLQINAAFSGLMSLKKNRLADLAAECGFSDQAHMTRSFVEFLGNSPVQFGNDIEPTLKRFVGHSRNQSKS
ncbi:MAG: helix-turn-helix domain-containing protein [Bacteroidota bacterium]